MVLLTLYFILLYMKLDLDLKFYLGLLKNWTSKATRYWVPIWIDSITFPGIKSNRILFPYRIDSRILMAHPSSPVSTRKQPMLDFLKVPWKFVSARTRPTVQRVNRKLNVFQGNWRIDSSGSLKSKLSLNLWVSIYSSIIFGK